MRYMGVKEQAALGEERFHCAFCDRALPVAQFARGAVSADAHVGVAICQTCFDDETPIIDGEPDPYPGWDGYTGVNGDEVC